MPKLMPSASTNGSDPDDANGKSSSGPGWRAKLTRLAEDHEEKARAIRLTLSLMIDTEKVSKKATHAQVLAAALAAEAARAEVPTRIGRPPGSRNKTKKKKYFTSHILKQREASAKLLARFGTEIPGRFKDASIGALVRRGYLVKKDDGYVRTDKPYEIQPGKGA